MHCIIYKRCYVIRLQCYSITLLKEHYYNRTITDEVFVIATTNIEHVFLVSNIVWPVYFIHFEMSCMSV
jgi:hypothetical protein